MRREKEMFCILAPSLSVWMSLDLYYPFGFVLIHATFVTALKPGLVKITSRTWPLLMHISGGHTVRD